MPDMDGYTAQLISDISVCKQGMTGRTKTSLLARSRSSGRRTQVVFLDSLRLLLQLMI